ncbi:MAG: hypothetical protein ACLQIB_50020 [Isosphaeraceae bacterium]
MTNDYPGKQPGSQAGRRPFATPTHCGRLRARWRSGVVLGRWFARQGGRAALAQTSGSAMSPTLLGPPTLSVRLGPAVGEFWAKRLEIRYPYRMFHH